MINEGPHLAYMRPGHVLQPEDEPKRQLRKLNAFTAFLCRLGGDSPEILSYVGEETEIIRSVAKGASMFIPTVTAFFGGFFTVQMMTQSHGAAILAGSLWAATILIIDRQLLSSIGTNFRSSVTILLRMGLTVLTSLAVTHAILFILFAGKLDEKAHQHRQTQLQAVDQQAAQSQSVILQGYQQQRERFTAQIDLIQQDIGALDRSIAKTRAELTQYQVQYQAELDGEGPSGKAGYGTVSKRIEDNHILPLQTELAKLQGTREALIQQRAGFQSQLLALHEKERSDPGLLTLQAKAERMTQAAESITTKDFLSRWMLLHELVLEDRSAMFAFTVMGLLLLLAELTPITAKLLAPKGLYEAEVQRRLKAFCASS